MTPSQFAHWLCDQLQDDLDSYRTQSTPTKPHTALAIVTKGGRRFAIQVTDLGAAEPRKDEPQ